MLFATKISQGGDHLPSGDNAVSAMWQEIPPHQDHPGISAGEKSHSHHKLGSMHKSSLAQVISVLSHTNKNQIILKFVLM